jgi:hypothetical protein
MRRKRSSSKREYHVALSFAGEDRQYVEQVAAHLLAAGVKVFYDKFEEASLWGKDLYVHLSDVYNNKAHFTVIFASKYYKKKLWANHELQSAQARAFESNREYILPTLFDKSVTIPGVLKTIAWISLWDRTPEDVAELIIKKLRGFGIEPSARFDYADEARADVDFPRPKGSPFTKIIDGMKSHHWPSQAPAVRSIFELDWSTLDKNQTFVIGRNIYQCADGSEHTAQGILNNLRNQLAKIPAEPATHLLNGMLFEVYFDHAGKFRGRKLRSSYLAKLAELQTVKKFAPSISFIHRELQPYKSHLPFVPCAIPEVVAFDLVLGRSDPALLRSLSLKGYELLAKDEADVVFPEQWWTVSLTKFTIRQLTARLSEKWSIPIAQIEINSSQGVDPETEYRLPKDYVIRWPRL